MSRWDEPYSSTIFSLAKEFARHQRVFYIDHPYTLIDAVRGNKQAHARHRWRALWGSQQRFTPIAPHLPNLIAVTPPLTLPINWANGLSYQHLARLNQRALHTALWHTIQHFSIPKKYLFFNSFNPFFANPLPPDLAPHRYIYQSTDAMQKGIYVAKHGVSLEQQLMRRADLCLVTSQHLQRYAQQFSPQVALLPNAADVPLFSQALSQSYPRPADLPATSQAVVLYVGNISRSRIDFALLQHLADQHPHKDLVCVGPIDSPDYQQYGLDRRPNVHFLPPKAIEQLPAYVQHSAVCIIPFLCNELTQSIYPLKINEYLAAGKPVVSTPFSPDITDFAHIAHIAATHQQFSHAIDTAIATDTPQLQQQRHALAQTNSWAARAQQCYHLVQQIW